MNKADRIIVALDVATEREAFGLVTQLRETVTWFKVGLQLYTGAGPKVVHAIVESGAKVFLDLKLHDIPNTVAGAVASAAALGVDMLTIHLSGGEAMIRAAVEAAGVRLAIVGVTVLTSQTDETLGTVGVDQGVERQVIRLAKLGVGCGICALVASPREAPILRAEFDSRVKIITPGIRPTDATTDDQKRIATPGEAIKAGADYLVIGRPIIADPEPFAAVRRILAELGDH
jgi:orotidine-5'-phosphate decarboxylase